MVPQASQPHSYNNGDNHLSTITRNRLRLTFNVDNYMSKKKKKQAKINVELRCLPDDKKRAKINVELRHLPDDKKQVMSSYFSVLFWFLTKH